MHTDSTMILRMRGLVPDARRRHHAHPRFEPAAGTCHVAGVPRHGAWCRMALSQRLIVLVALTLVAACQTSGTTTSSSSSGGVVCALGDTQGCTCPDGTEGTQGCRADG